jgi:hypothetical protein
VETMTLDYQRFENSAVMFIFSHLFEDQSAAPSAEQTFTRQLPSFLCCRNRHGLDGDFLVTIKPSDPELIKYLNGT